MARLGWVWIILILFKCNQADAFPRFEEVRAKTIPSEAVLYDRNQEVIHEQRINSRYRQLSWTKLTEVSPIFKKAILLSEDQRFFEHRGVDWKAALVSTAENLFRKRPRGASTITMQLASILDRDLAPLSRRRGVLQKIRQAREARELERFWSKDQIFEAYLNLIPFRSEFRGVSAAAYGLFGKAPEGLNFSESILLAALVPSPQAPIAQVRTRACLLAQRLEAQYRCEGLDQLIASQGGSNGNLRNLLIAPQIALAPHVAQKLLLAPTAVSTLDLRTQEYVLASLKRQILALKAKNVQDAAALVVDNQTGDVLAYVGNVGTLSSAFYVDGVKAQRQAGSTLKPFLHGLAFELRYLTPASLVDDTPGDFPVAGGTYRPRNYDHEFHGENISVRVALASSLNVPAVRALNLVGVDPFTRKLKELGIENLEDSEFYGPSLALGSADVTLWDLVNAYRTFANQGKWGPLRLDMTQPTQQPGRFVYTPEVAFLVSQILSDRESRSLTFGLDNPMALPFWVAAKTGTSKDMRDNWCIGYSSRYTVGVWVGNFSGDPMWNVSGVSGAAPAWSEIMSFLHRKVPSHPPRSPEGVVQVATESDEQSTRGRGEGTGSQLEWYLKGTEPPVGLRGKPQLAIQTQVRITYPVAGTIIARDPDIPLEAQKVVFQHSRGEGPLKWQLNGKDLAPGGDAVLWGPEKPGRYHLTLVDAKGVVVDEVRFLVR